MGRDGVKLSIPPTDAGGGPLRANLSWHPAGINQLKGKADGYSLDVQGWLKIIRF